MTSATDTDHVLRSLSARMSVIEVAIAALAPTDPASQKRTVIAFDALAQALLDQYLGMPVDETYLELVRGSIADVRALLTSRN